MPWQTPTLREVRGLVRDAIRASLPGADASVPNSVLRVLSDAQGALAHLTLQYLDWLALQLMVDTAETEWLDRHGDIWLVNSDGSTGRKAANLAQGIIAVSGTPGTVVPQATRFAAADNIQYETLEQISIGTEEQTPVPARALDPGAIGNRLEGSPVGVVQTNSGISDASIVVMTGGTDEENDDDLRIRVLLRIRNPPMGGDAMDYVQWTLAVPGVTRAWSAPLEQGIGTVTVRFMCDVLRAEQDGFPQSQDIDRVTAYLDIVRPVAIKDYFVVSPVPEPIDFQIDNLDPDDAATRQGIVDSVEAMLREKAAPAHASPITGQTMPAQTIYAAWVSAAIMDAPNVVSFYLVMDDHPMPHAGALAVLGTITYGP